VLSKQANTLNSIKAEEMDQNMDIVNDENMDSPTSEDTNDIDYGNKGCSSTKVNGTSGREYQSTVHQKKSQSFITSKTSKINSTRQLEDDYFMNENGNNITVTNNTSNNGMTTVDDDNLYASAKNHRASNGNGNNKRYRLNDDDFMVGSAQQDKRRTN